VNAQGAGWSAAATGLASHVARTTNTGSGYEYEVSYVSPLHQNGAASFDYQVRDTGTGALTSSVETITINVADVNYAPTGSTNPASPISCNEDSSVTFTLQGADVDVPAQTLSFRIKTVPPAAQGPPHAGRVADRRQRRAVQRRGHRLHASPAVIWSQLCLLQLPSL